MMIKAIGTTAVVVKNAAKAAKWYNDFLGFEVEGDPKEHWVTVGTKGAEHRLHLCEYKPLEKGNTGTAFLCDDVKKTYEKLKNKGVNFTKKPEKQPWGTFAMMADPDGNEFWLVETSE